MSNQENNNNTQQEIQDQNVNTEESVSETSESVEAQKKKEVAPLVNYRTTVDEKEREESLREQSHFKKKNQFFTYLLDLAERDLFKKPEETKADTSKDIVKAIHDPEFERDAKRLSTLLTGVINLFDSQATRSESALTAEREKLQSQLDKKDEIIQSLKEKINSFNGIQEELNDLHIKYAAVNREKKSALETIDTLNKTNNTLSEDKKTLEGKINDLNTKLQQLEAEAKLFDTKTAGATAQHENEIKALKDEHENKIKEFQSQHKAEIETLKSGQVEAIRAAVKAEQMKDRKEILELKGTIEDLNKANKQFKQDLDREKQLNDSLAQMFSNLKFTESNPDKNEKE